MLVNIEIDATLHYICLGLSFFLTLCLEIHATLDYIRTSHIGCQNASIENTE